jgi:hypothetical protein
MGEVFRPTIRPPENREYNPCTVFEQGCFSCVPSHLNFPAILGLLALLGAPGTSNHLPTRPEALDTQAQKSEQPQTLPRQIDLLQVQKRRSISYKSRNKGNDPARLAQAIPPDVAGMRKGRLPKEVIEQLKQIEKLSKRLKTDRTHKNEHSKQKVAILVRKVEARRWPPWNGTVRSSASVETPGPGARPVRSRPIPSRDVRDCH